MARNTSVTLGQHFDAYAAEKISEGRYQSVSEIVRAGLRKLEDDDIKLQSLRLKLQAGEDSPLAEAIDSEAFIAALHKNTAQSN